ncbi:MAG: SDR family NAD(P)-dependent oxidoreductase [Verrucomicrobiota bacterium]
MFNRFAIVIGGSGGIGQALVTELSLNSWQVEAPGSHDLDVRDPKAIRSYFTGKTPDLFVYAAGITRDALLVRSSEKDWDETWSVNFTGAALCTTAVIPAMIARKFGHIVLLSSWSALHPPVGQAAYAASKAELLGLANNLARTHGPSNIRINTILPGFLETRMTTHISAERRQEILKDHVLGRFNTCASVASFIRYLHEELPHTSGQVFQLDSRTV